MWLETKLCLDCHTSCAPISDSHNNYSYNDDDDDDDDSNDNGIKIIYLYFLLEVSEAQNHAYIAGLRKQLKHRILIKCQQLVAKKLATLNSFFFGGGGGEWCSERVKA